MSKTGVRWLSRDREGLREVLIQQYFLHEVQHHPSTPSQESQPLTVVPRAHMLVDIYKCLHQGEFGVEHNIRNPKKAKEELAHELARTKPTSGEPVLEKVAADGSKFRVNLRPYLEVLKGDDSKACDLLIQVCFESAKMEEGSAERFIAALRRFRALNNKGELGVGGMILMFPKWMVENFLIELDTLSRHLGTIPVFSHSSVYRYYNSPSYRVVSLAVLRDSPLAFLLQQ